MNLRSVCYGGIAGGIVAAVVMTAAGKLLGVTLAPWSSLSLWSGYLGHVIVWSETGNGQLIIFPLGLEALFLIALIELITQLARSFEGIRHAAPDEPQGFEPIGVVPVIPTARRADAPAAP